jgi:hypothetical protein
LSIFVYFAVRQFLLVCLDKIQYADSKSDVRFVPAGQEFELYILAPFTVGRNMLLYDCGLHGYRTYQRHAAWTCRHVATVDNSFRQGRFPITLRTAAVRPLVKSDSRQRPGKELHSSLSEAFVGKVLSKVAVRRLHFEWAA